MNENVVALEKHRERPTALSTCEFRIDETTFELEATLRDTEGGVFILTFGLLTKPRDFDLSRLIEAWSRWRQESSVAS